MSYIYYGLQEKPYAQTLTLFCPDLPHKLLFLPHFPSYGLTSVYSAIPVLLSSCLLLVHCCSKASCAKMCPNSSVKGMQSCRNHLEGLRQSVLGLTLWETLLVPYFL